MLSCLVRQKQWGWEITAAMTVNTSKIKNSDGGSDGNNHDMMLKNITHTPWHPGSSIKEQNKWINTHSWPISFREVSPKLWLFYCLQIVSNTSTNPCFGNKRINCCMGIFIAMVSFSGYFRYTLKKKKLSEHIIKDIKLHIGCIITEWGWIWLYDKSRIESDSWRKLSNS